MRKIREVLRLKWAVGMSNRRIAVSCGIGWLFQPELPTVPPISYRRSKSPQLLMMVVGSSRRPAQVVACAGIRLPPRYTSSPRRSALNQNEFLAQQDSRPERLITTNFMSYFDLSLDPDSQLNLKLTELRLGAPGITRAFGEGLAEAASVCLEDQEHSSPTPMQVSGELAGHAILEWEPTTGQAQRCWNDDEVATEHGAYGIATLLVQQVSDLQVVQRSKKGTGFDYWLGSATEEESLFQNRARLEVSGIRNATESRLVERVSRKLKQTKRSDESLPALVVVVEFGEPQSRIAKR